jgi:hypothetical protein
VCAELVAPLGWIGPAEATNGDSGDGGAEDLPLESRTCPACRTRLQRTPPGGWELVPGGRRVSGGSQRRFSKPD